MGVIGTAQHTTAGQQARRARDRPGRRSQALVIAQEQAPTACNFVAAA